LFDFLFLNYFYQFFYQRLLINLLAYLRVYIKLKKNASIEEILIKRPTILDVNLDAELEKLLKEIHYLRMEPLSVDLADLLKGKFSRIKDENELM
jgi:hypothetical protein